MKSNNRSHTFAPTPSVLALSLAAIFSFSAPLTANASNACTGEMNGAATSLSLTDGGDCTITADGSVTGSTGVVNNYYAVNAFYNNGLISITGNGVDNLGTIGLLSNTGTIYGSSSGIVNAASITSIVNTGLISGQGGNQYGGITNGGYDEIYAFNDGTIGTITNKAGGTITGAAAGIYNNSGSTISLIDNQAGATIGSDGFAGINNAGVIGAIDNAGTLGIAGTTGYAILNSGSIGSLVNDGTINATNGAGLYNSGTIDSVTNNGVIEAHGNGIVNSGGTIGTLTNNGTISASSFAFTGSGVGTLVNTGLIAGDISNSSTTGLTIVGGTGTTFGTLTGYQGTIGQIYSTSSDIVLASGNVLLNDNVSLASHTLNNLAATLQVNNTVSIVGNYTQDANATLLIGVASNAVANGAESDTGYGRLYVNGVVTIAAGSSVALTGTTGSYSFAAGQRFVVIESTSDASNYNAGSLVYSAVGSTLTVSGAQVTDGSSGNTDLVLTVGSSSSSGGDSSTTNSNSATTRNAVSSLGGLQRYTGISDAALLNLYNASLAISGTAEANRAGSQLSPTQQASASRAAAAPTFDTLSIIAAHSDSIRMAQAGQSGVATGDAVPLYGVWGQVFGGHASQGVVDSVSGYSANYTGMLVGADRAFGDRWHAGGAFSYSNTLISATDDNAGSSTRVNAYGLTGYASYTGEPWYLNLSAGVTQQRYNSKRVIDFTGYSGVAYGAFSGQQYVARAEFGYPLALASMTLTPIASLTYSYLHQDGYTETGGNGAALAVGTSHSSSVRSALGAKLERSFSSQYGDIVPFAQVQWIHEFVKSQQLTTAAYAAATSETAFTSVGASPVSNLASVAFGASLVRSNNLTLSARFEVQAGAHFVSETGTLRLRKLF